MFLPLGDNVEKRDFPAVGAILVAINCLVFLYMNRLWNESAPMLEPYDAQYTYAYLQNDKRGMEEAQRHYLSVLEHTSYGEFDRKWWASPANVKQGHVMSVVTSMFLHADFWHLFGNMIVLWAFVGTLESAMGAGLFFTFYLLWGIAGAGLHLYFEWDKDIGLVGASGAISGMIGAYFVAFGALTKIRTLMLFLYVFYPWLIQKLVFDVPAGLFVFIWAWFQIAGMAEQEKLGMEGGGVAFLAHLGGFAAGALTMLAMKPQIMSKLEVDKAGKLTMKGDMDDKTTMAATEDPEEVPEAPAATGPTCTACNVALEASHRVHGSLYRCPQCQRLILHN